MKYRVLIVQAGSESTIEIIADSDEEALEKAESYCPKNYGTSCCTIVGRNWSDGSEWPEKVTRKGKKRKFMATVFERFSDAFEVWAENEKEAREIVEASIPDDFCPSATGGGYGREITIDPDFSD